MPTRYRFLQLDVFTDHVFGGNQLAVFPDAAGLSDAQMQDIAREMNFSESTFVLPPTDPAAALCRVRIFTPGVELPFAGHPVVGTAFALAHEGRIGPDVGGAADGDAQVAFELGVGTLPVVVSFAQRHAHFAWMTQPVPTFEAWRGDSAALAAALGLAPADLDTAAFPLESGSAGVRFAYVPIRSTDALGRAVPQATLSSLLDAAGCLGAYLFTMLSGGSVLARARMFASGAGIVEDPATGSAAGPLGAYLVRHGHLRPGAEGSVQALIEQGIEMGRPSQIEVAVTGTADAIQAVRVGGQAVLVAEATLLLGPDQR